MQFWYMGTDNFVTCQGLKDSVGAYVNNATVSGVVQDSRGNAVSDVLTFTYDQGSNGNYKGTFPSTVPMKEGKDYELVVTITRGNEKLTARITRRAAFFAA